MAKRESSLRSKLMRQFELDAPSFVVLRHEDVRYAGNPDFSVTGNNVTSWGEVKHGDPAFEWRGIQHDTMLRLAVEGWAWYVVYWENNGRNLRTLIIPPVHIETLETPFDVPGHDHAFVVDFFKRMHN
jgi:hypothetical protein